MRETERINSVQGKRSKNSIIIAAILLLLGILACESYSTMTGIDPTMTSEVYTSADTIAEPTAVPPTPEVERFSFPTALPPTPMPPTATPELAEFTGHVDIFPGPEHYEGDQLTIELGVSNYPVGATHPLITIDGEPIEDVISYPMVSPWLDEYLFIPLEWETEGQVGWHTITIAMADVPAQPLTFDIEILPADELPPLEAGAEWMEIYTPNCVYTMVTNSAAQRDFAQLHRLTLESIYELERTLGRTVWPQPIYITFLGNIWGNGGYASGSTGIVVTYTDRDFAPAGTYTVIKHEMTHWTMNPLANGTPTLFIEGIAVYAAGGHYKPEPIAQRAAVLMHNDGYIPLRELADDFRHQQHETAYIESAGFVTYLIEHYGMNMFMEMYASQNPGETPSEWLEAVFQRFLAKSLDEVESEFRIWLLLQDYEGQVADLEASIALNEITRDYQVRHANFQQSIGYHQQNIEEGIVAVSSRRPQDIENVTIEVMLVAAQQALRNGTPQLAMTLGEAVREVLESADYSAEPTAAYLAIVETITELGYIPLTVDIHEYGAICSVRKPDSIQKETLRLAIDTNGNWGLMEAGE